ILADGNEPTKAFIALPGMRVLTVGRLSSLFQNFRGSRNSLSTVDRNHSCFSAKTKGLPPLFNPAAYPLRIAAQASAGFKARLFAEIAKCALEAKRTRSFVYGNVNASSKSLTTQTIRPS